MRPLVLLFFSVTALSAPAAQGGAVPTDWSYVQKKLTKAGFKKKFITAMRKNYDPAEFTSVVELNSLLFLRKADYHTPQINAKAVSEVRQFLIDHEKAFDSAEKKYGVSRPVIAGLLWMESRYGENLGRFHVASVFVDLIQADRPQVIAHLKLEAAPRFTPRLTTKVAADVTAKAKAKAKWALAELKAIEKMYLKDRDQVIRLRGSFAGAFGMAQFIPSSYIAYARAAKKGKTPDLTRADDAIHSVANYLKKSGWKNGRSKSHERALLRYNNSIDYARAILKLADEADVSGKRLPAGKRKRKKGVKTKDA